MVIYLLPTLAVPLFILVNDHRLYVPLAGGIILLAGILFPAPIALRRAYIGVLIVFAALVVQRNQVWHDEYTLWTDVERKSPEPFGKPIAYIHLGNYSRDHGELDKAVGYYRRALEMSPEHVAAKNNLANALEKLGQPEEARGLYEEVLAEHPDLAEPRYNLGRLAYFQGRPHEAIYHLRAVPDDSYHHDLALNMLGVVYEKVGRLDSAVSFYRRALAAKFESADAADNMARLLRRFGELGRGLMESGQLKQVESVSRQLLETNPRHRDSLFFLGVSLFHQGLVGESGEVNRYLVESHPDFIEGYIQLGNLYETLGELEGAAAVYEEAYRRVRDRDLRELLGQRLSGVRGRLVQ